MGNFLDYMKNCMLCYLFNMTSSKTNCNFELIREQANGKLHKLPLYIVVVIVKLNLLSVKNKAKSLFAAEQSYA